MYEYNNKYHLKTLILLILMEADADNLPTLFTNLKGVFPKLDDETIWNVMMAYPLDGNWDTCVINKLLEVSGEKIPQLDKDAENLIVNESHEEEDDSVYPDNTLPMRDHHSDMNDLKRRKFNKDEFDFDEFDKDFNFDYKKKDDGVNMSRFFDTLSGLWNGDYSKKKKNDDYELNLLTGDKKRK